MIKKVLAREGLDSRGNPTVEAEVFSSKFRARAMVPSGASTGVHEALELRDGGRRYLGRGVSKAVRNVSLIAKKLIGRKFGEADEIMLALDGTANKKKLGANAILAVSMAVCRLAAMESKKPLYKYVSKIAKGRPAIPVPFCNIINGGRHAENELAMQEFMIAPTRAANLRSGVQAVAETYHTLKQLIMNKYGRNSANVGDEGGFAPPIKKAEEALTLIQKAIDKSGNSKIMKLADLVKFRQFSKSSCS